MESVKLIFLWRVFEASWETDDRTPPAVLT